MKTRLILIAATWAVVVGVAVGSAHAQAPTQPGGQFSLIGVVMLEGGRNLAFIQEPNLTNDKVVAVRLGDNVGPYRVTKILTHQVELTGSGGTVVIPLAGLPGAVVVVSGTGAAHPAAAGGQPEAALKPTPNVVIPPGDPRGEFPASALLIGAGAAVSLPEARWSQASQAQGAGAQAPQTQSASAQVFSSSSAAAQPPAAPAQDVVLSRGDPRRNFPAAELLLGAR